MAIFISLNLNIRISPFRQLEMYSFFFLKTLQNHIKKCSFKIFSSLGQYKNTNNVLQFLII